MFCYLSLHSVLVISLVSSYVAASETILKWPTVGISILVRNKAHTLPYFLSCLYNLDYPKDRIYIWISSDHNEDDSDKILDKWVEQYGLEYNGIHLSLNSSTSGKLFPDEVRSTHWSEQRFAHVIDLREEALDYMRKIWADYIFMLDADVFLTNKDTLKILVKKDLTIVAPMLISDGSYSNFWCGMSDDFYYKRTEDYTPILERATQGCFAVPMVHSALLVHLEAQASDALSYRPARYDGPLDDIIAFAVNANNHSIAMHICNDHEYGFVPVPASDTDDADDERELTVNVKLLALGRHSPLPLDPLLASFVRRPPPARLGCCEIFMINLERRPERRRLMELSFKELGMDVTLIKAVDGRTLDMNDLRKHKIKLMPGYEDPYHKRPMKAGEIGCFLSHYMIWNQVVSEQLEVALVLEDDIHFVAHFRQRFALLMEELKTVDWDLVYIGRKILQNGEESYVTQHTTRPRYSYWTLGYLLSRRGAAKLLAAQPLARVLPVDEFLPIMFDQHPK
ncbi:glycosyltransferase 25 family member [Ostrinia nubilalis]|uniref:glycosyltransferase 25 family member n=1 Tax=Ostrinia nubilalis TaxID=29057 RepID=UPI0030822E60